MAEYIDKQEAIETVTFYLGDPDGVDHALQSIKGTPTADVQPVVHGKNLKEEWPSLFECSVCHWSCWDTYCGDTDTYNYCPNCGATMDGKE